VRRPLALLLVAPVVVLVAVGGRTLFFRSRQVEVEPAVPIALVPGAAERLAAALRFRTVSHQDPARLDGTEFLRLHRFLREAFPRTHRALEREVVERYSLLFTWPGRDAGRRPLLLLAHLDVVPVDAGAEAKWTEPPFAGHLEDGWVWGRGAMDDKASLVGLLEAVEHLLAEGFEPRRTVHLAFGHDEEVGGLAGAVALSARLGARGVRPELVLDEGMAIAEGVFPGLERTVALVGIAEKGYLSVELVVEGEGGHSSTPPPETAVGILARAVARLERGRPPAAIAGATRRLLEFLGPEMSLASRVALANLWLFGGAVERRLVGSPAGDALIRTTTAPTMLEGSAKENVLPVRARAIVNFRIRPGETTKDVLAHVRAGVDDARVQVRAVGPTRSEPSAESSVVSAAFTALARTIRETFPEVIVAPSLVLGATDARHYAALGGDVYRFLPYHVRAEDIRRAHGTDERIGVEDYENLVRFYVRLVRNVAG
jgi:carboxypeptidase PM20D1